MKKGFTIIELLSVIIIIALISLIVIPIVSNRKDNAKESTLKETSLSYIKAVEKEITNQELKNDKTLSGTFTVSQNVIKQTDEYKLDLNGTLPNSGTITVDSNGKVTTATFVYDKHQVTYNNGDIVVEQI